MIAIEAFKAYSPTNYVCSRFVRTSGALEFTVRVIHSIPLHMSAVHVFQGDRMIVVSHLAGTDQLPSIQQVCLQIFIA